MSLSLEAFKRRYEEGRLREAMIHEKLIEVGLPSVLSEYTPPEVGANVVDFTKHAKDIVVGGEIIIEVKSRGGTCANFTGPEDFPWDTAMVDTVYGWRMKAEKPHYYVFVAQGTGGIAVVDGSTHEEWLEGIFYDRVERKRNRTYVVNKNLLKSWDWLVEELRGKFGDFRTEGERESDGGLMVQGQSEADGPEE